MGHVYEPSRRLSAKISRRITPYLERRMLPLKLERPVVSFTFDDCPVSAIENGIKPLEALGWKSTIYVACSLLGETNHHGQQVSAQDVRALHNSGHEIGGHTFSHIDAQQRGLSEYLVDIDKNQEKLQSLGLPKSRTFAYPYGQTEPRVKRALSNEFIGLRGITAGVHKSAVDLNQIKSVPLFSGPRVNKAIETILSLKDQPAWVTFFTHDIRDNNTDWGCTPHEMSAVISAVQSVGADVLSVQDAIDKFRKPQ